jgi:hypothetical protein
LSDSVPDLTGTDVKVGDRIAYAVTAGRSGCLRVGKVIEIVWGHHKEPEKRWISPVPTKLRVEVEISSSYGTPEKPVLIEAGFKRFVKID